MSTIAPSYFEKRLYKLLNGFSSSVSVWRHTKVRGQKVDFYVPALRIAIQLDPKDDPKKDAQLFKQKITVMRFKKPTSIVEVNDIYSVFYAEVRYRQNGRISTNPQASLEIRGFLNTFKNSERSENPGKISNAKTVEKKVNSLPRKDLEGGKNCGFFVDTRDNCKHQVFASHDVAERACDNLRKLGIRCNLVRCSRCKRSYIEELDNAQE